MQDSNAQDGFILQASYRISEGRPVVYLFGCLTTGETFLVRDARQVPHFFVPTLSLQKQNLPPMNLLQSSRVDLLGNSVSRVNVEVPQEAPVLRDRLHQLGVDTFEADVRFAVRYLIDRGIKGGCRILGQAKPGQGVDLCFDEPTLEPADVRVVPRVLSFDIETDPGTQQLLAISIYGCGADTVAVVDPKGRSMPDKALGLRNEASALQWFASQVRQLDPDIITGWNVIDFDLSFLSAVAQRLGVSFGLGRIAGAMRIRAAEGYFGSGSANIPGRVVLDGMDLVRGAFIKFDEYSLDAVARAVLGEGKALHGEATDRVGEILDGYNHNLDQFALYARTDARLALAIVEKLDLVNFAFERSLLTGMTPDRVSASIASFDFLYLAELHQRGIVAPSVRSSDSRVHSAQAGGHVLDSMPGMHENVWVFDFKSLYPSIIRTFNIDPLGYLAPDQGIVTQAAESPIDMPGGALFRREPGILPAILDELFPRRVAAQRAGNAVASQAIKILMNSFYGVLGTPACRFYNPAIANAITGQGRYLLLWSKAWFEDRGFSVLYGDTDSLFVSALSAQEPTDGASISARGAVLATQLTQDIGLHVQKRWGVVSRMELEFEKLYSKLLLPYVRHGTSGARKRYVGMIWGEQALEFVGMEVVRRDWTDLAKTVQRELYRRLFAQLPVSDYLSTLVAGVRAGEHDRQLIYRKGLRKKAAEYVANTPPHVIAARKSAHPNNRIVSYVLTTAGPEPLDNLAHAPDYEHYVQKQVRPVAEPVLAALGLEFAQVVGDDRQIALF